MDENEKEFHSEPIYNKLGEYLGNLDLPTAKYPLEVDYDYWGTRKDSE